MSHPCKFVILGNPPIKKNSRDIVRNARTGRMYPIKSKGLEGAEEDALYQLGQQIFKGFSQYMHPIRVKFLFYRKDRRKVDLSNLYEFPQDVLQSAGIIENDALIESHDGSRKYYDPENPRTEIYIYPFKE